MYLSRLSLTNYRNFLTLDLRLPPGLVFIVGANGEGKSNLLEAAYLLAIAKSYRANAEREIVHWAAQSAPLRRTALEGHQAIVHGEVEHQGGRLKVIVGLRLLPDEGTGGPLVEKEIRVNGVAATASGLVGRVNAVLFTVGDVDLVQGTPAQRRRFLDILISQVDRAYLRALQRYQRVLTQRNHLLRLIREGRSARAETEFWDSELAKEGSFIVARRQQVVERLAPLAAQAYGRLARGEQLSVSFQPSAPAQELTEALTAQREREIQAGATLVGPHRDDLGLALGERSAALYASRGQARTIAVALRLGEAAFLREERREEPLLLLDDVLSELDASRRRQVLEEAATYQQALITLAEPRLIQGMPVKPSATYLLKDGSAVPAVV